MDENYFDVDSEKSYADGLSSNSSNCTYVATDNLHSKFILLVIVTPIICLLGITGNLLAILVFSMKQTMQMPNRNFLTALCVSNIGVLSSAMMIFSVEIVYDYTQNVQLYFVWFSYVKPTYLVSHICCVGTVYLTVSATAERFIAITFPRRSRKWCSSRMTYIFIFSICSFVVALTLPKYFELQIVEFPSCKGFGRYLMDLSELGLNKDYFVIYNVWLSNLLIVFIPFGMLLMLNSLITWKMARCPDSPSHPLVELTTTTTQKAASKRRKGLLCSKSNHLENGNKSCAQNQSALNRPETQYRQNRSKQRRKRRENTIVVLVVVGVFLICNIPSVILTLCEHAWNKFLMDHKTFYSFAKDTVNLMTIINSSADFIIYIIFAKDFRRALLRIVCRNHSYGDADKRFYNQADISPMVSQHNLQEKSINEKGNSLMSENESTLLDNNSSSCNNLCDANHKCTETSATPMLKSINKYCSQPQRTQKSKLPKKKRIQRNIYRTAHYLWDSCKLDPRGNHAHINRASSPSSTTNCTSLDGPNWSNTYVLTSDFLKMWTDHSISKSKGITEKVS